MTAIAKNIKTIDVPHEGLVLKTYILDKKESIADVADKMNLTKQNLYQYFRKPKITLATKRLFAQFNYNPFNLPTINYGQALKSYLEHHDLSPRELEKKIKIPYNVIYYSLGKDTFSRELLEALEKRKIDLTKYAGKGAGLKSVNGEINRLKKIISNQDETIKKLKSEIRQLKNQK